MPPRRKATAAVDTAPVPKPKKAKTDRPEPDFLDEEFASPDLDAIRAVMGFGSFGTTKNKDHSASDCYAAVKLVKRKTARMVREKTG